MGVFDKEISIIKDINNEIFDVLISVLKKNEVVILDYQINDQHLKKGQGADGSVFSGYSNSYARIRIKRKLQVSHVDFHFTGKYHESLYLIIENDKFRIVSDVKYSDYLEKEGRKKVLGIQKTNLEVFVENYLYPELKIMINDKLTRTNS